MPRKYGHPAPRFIHPETVRSEQIRELAKNKDHLLCWYGLFHACDDQGRLEARVSTIQTHALGHLPDGSIKPRTIQEALVRMQQIRDEDDVPLVYLYDAAGTKVLQIAGWWKHQSGMRNAWPSRWPPMAGWVDDIRGHGKAALEDILASRSGDGGGTMEGQSFPIRPPSNLNHNQVSNDTSVQPRDLFQAFLDIRGIEWKDYPSPSIQLRHAKMMLKDGWTVEEVQTAAKAFEADDFWSTKGYDLASLNAHWGKMKSRLSPAARKPRPLKPIGED